MRESSIAHETGGKHEYLKSFTLASKPGAPQIFMHKPEAQKELRLVDYVFVLDSPPPTYKKLGD